MFINVRESIDTVCRVCSICSESLPFIIQGEATCNELWQPGNEKIAGQPLSPVLAKLPIWSRELVLP